METKEFVYSTLEGINIVGFGKRIPLIRSHGDKRIGSNVVDITLLGVGWKN